MSIVYEPRLAQGCWAGTPRGDSLLRALGGVRHACILGCSCHDYLASHPKSPVCPSHRAAVHVELTQEEAAAVDRLAAMGFDRDLCLEASRRQLAACSFP